jgi:hypothetical protein
VALQNGGAEDRKLAEPNPRPAAKNRIANCPDYESGARLADLRRHLGLTSTRVTSRSITPINAFLPFSTEPLRGFGFIGGIFQMYSPTF